MKYLLIIALLFSVPGFADCEKSVTKEPAGTTIKLNCDVWIVTEDKMQEFARTDDKLKAEQGISQLNKQLLSLSAAEVEFYKSRSKSQSKELEQSESRRFWSTAAGFTLGVILTGIAAKAAIEATK